MAADRTRCPVDSNSLAENKEVAARRVSGQDNAVLSPLVLTIPHASRGTAPRSGCAGAQVPAAQHDAELKKKKCSCERDSGRVHAGLGKTASVARDPGRRLR